MMNNDTLSLICRFLFSPIIFIKNLVNNIFLSNKKILIFTLSIIFFMLGLYITPINTCDLNNYWSYINTYTDKSILEIWNLNYQNLFVIDFVFWILANFLSKEFFSAICGLIIFYVMFRICFSIINNESISDYRKYLILILGFLTINLPLVYSSGRNFTAISIFMLALFREYFEQKKNFLTYILYIVPIFIHETMIIYLIIRVMIIFFKKYNLLFLNCCLVLFVLFLPFFVDCAYFIFNSIDFNFFFLDTIRSLIFKAYNYFHLSNSDYLRLSQTLYYIVQRILYSLIFIVSIIISNIYLFKNNNKNMSIKQLDDRQKLVTISMFISYIGLCFGLFISGNIYCRYMMVPLLSNIFIVTTFFNEKKHNKLVILIITILYFLHFILAFYLFINLLHVDLRFFIFLISPLLLLMNL